jgi:hypothetical protein
MNTQKVLIGGIIGGVVYFFLGWLVWGVLLKDMMSAPESVARGDENFIMWAMIVSCIVYGLFLAYIYNKWAGISTFSTGASAGALIGGVLSLFIGLAQHSMLNYVSLQQVALDVVASAVVTAIIGGIIGWYLGRE